MYNYGVWWCYSDRGDLKPFIWDGLGLGLMMFEGDDCCWQLQLVCRTLVVCRHSVSVQWCIMGAETVVRGHPRSSQPVRQEFESRPQMALVTFLG